MCNITILHYLINFVLTNHTSPHFCHDIKDGERPVTNDCQRRRKSGWQKRRQHITECVRMQHSTIWVQNNRKEGEKCQKGPNTGVKDVPLFHFIGQRCIDSRETNGSRQVYVSLDERDDFGSTFWCRDHQNIFRVSQNRVIEQYSEKHHGQGEQFFAFFLRWDDRFDLFQCFCAEEFQSLAESNNQNSSE